MAIPFYESVLAKRLPTGNSVSFEAMKDIHKSRGWLGDTLLLNTFSYTERIKNRRAMSLLPDHATAAKWKELSIPGTHIDGTHPPSPYGLTHKRLKTDTADIRER